MTDIKMMLSINLSKELYDEIEQECQKQGRSKNKQIIHWIKLGKLLDSNPDIRTALQLKEQLQ